MQVGNLLFSLPLNYVLKKEEILPAPAVVHALPTPPGLRTHDFFWLCHLSGETHFLFSLTAGEACERARDKMQRVCTCLCVSLPVSHHYVL